MKSDKHKLNELLQLQTTSIKNTCKPIKQENTKRSFSLTCAKISQ